MLRGVVLCGGQSKRMGRDKGLLRTGSCTWAEFTEKKLTNLGLRVCISINETQRHSYDNVFPLDQLIVDAINVKGPLKGILSVHRRFPEDDLLVLPCDMIDMNDQTLGNLVLAYKSDTCFDYYSYVIDNYIQPFPSIYPFRTLSTITEKADKHELSSFSLTKLIEASNSRKIESTAVTSFSNYNDPNSIKR